MCSWFYEVRNWWIGNKLMVITASFATCLPDHFKVINPSICTQTDTQLMIRCCNQHIFFRSIRNLLRSSVDHLDHWCHSERCHTSHKGCPLCFTAGTGFQAFKSSTFRNLSGNLFSCTKPQWPHVPVCVCMCVSLLCEGGQLACPNSSRSGTGWSRNVTPVEPQRSALTRSPSVRPPPKLHQDHTLLCYPVL